MSWPVFGWMLLALPLGKLIDLQTAVRVLPWLLALAALLAASVFLGARGPLTFVVTAFLLIVVHSALGLAVLAYSQEVFPRDRFAQFSAVGGIAQTVAIGLCVVPLCGWYLDLLHGWSWVLDVPGVPPLAVGRYRLMLLVQVVIYLMGWVAARRVHALRAQLGGEPAERATDVFTKG
jgi:MFS family permease